MADNSIGIVFWLVAFVAVVSAIATVTLRKVEPVFLSLGLNILSVIGLLTYLGFVGFSLIYLMLTALMAVSMYFAFRKKINSISGTFQFDTHARTGWFFIAALLFFTGCLFLIANTEVWQYAALKPMTPFSELMSSLAGNYSLLMILAVVFITLLLFILFMKPQPRDS